MNGAAIAYLKPLNESVVLRAMQTITFFPHGKCDLKQAKSTG